jgi:hypothetical protein
MKERIDSQDGPFECVEPALGDQLGLLPDPDLAPDVRKQLNDHLAICDSCRLELAIEQRVAAGLADGLLTLDTAGATHRSPRRPRFLAWGGGVAMAASLALMFLLPPTPSGPEVLRRSGDEEPRFVRPVEGELVGTATPELKWTAIDGATAYRLQISKIGGEAVWSARVKTTSVRVPESLPLTGPASYRAILEPVPADLAGFADVNVTFRRDGTAPFLAYRLQAAPVITRWLGAAGLAAWGLGTLGLFSRRKPQPA